MEDRKSPCVTAFGFNNLGYLIQLLKLGINEAQVSDLESYVMASHRENFESHRL